MPQALRDKMQRASLFNKGYDMTELLSAALLDMRWHSLEMSASSSSVDQFEQQALAAEDLDLQAVPPRYRSSYFAHILAVAMPRVITPIYGRKCWPMTVISGL